MTDVTPCDLAERLRQPRYPAQLAQAHAHSA